MGTPGRSEFPVVEEGVNNAIKWHFVQLLRWLESHQNFENYTLTATPSLSFPSADIQHINALEKTVYCRFMGLYGVDAPLPHYFLFEALREITSAEVMRAFLTLFHHRLYQLYYYAWKKFQPAISLEQQDDRYLHYLIAISGNALTRADVAEFAAAGLLGKRVHSAIDLASVLQGYLEDVPVTISQFIPRWVKMQNNNIVSKGFCLGNNSIIGERILDLSSQIQITLGPLLLTKALTLLPREWLGKKLRHLIQRYLSPHINYQLCVLIQSVSASPLRLGEDAILLGLQSWVGEVLDKHAVTVCSLAG